MQKIAVGVATAAVLITMSGSTYSYSVSPTPESDPYEGTIECGIYCELPPDCLDEDGCEFPPGTGMTCAGFGLADMSWGARACSPFTW